LDNKPLVRATVIFFPESPERNPGPGSVGKTDDQGQFTLRMMSGNDSGAIVGKHKVTITAYEGDDKVVPNSSGKDNFFRKPMVPRRYNVETILTFEVPPDGTTSANFDLKSN
jgi:hypothetical protein